MRLQITTTILVSLLSRCSVLASDESWKLQREYFRNINISCTDSEEVNQTVDVQVWVLPSGDIVRPNEGIANNHIMVSENGMLLRIFKLDDADFGLYLCVYRDENTTWIIRKGINLDGPFYGEEIVNGYKRKAVVGGICAGIAFGMIFIACLVCSLCKHIGNADIEKGTEIVETNKNGIPPSCKVVTEESKEGTSDLDLSTTLGGSIYDTADGLFRNTADNETNKVIETFSRKDVESVQSESGHYQSIGSLERDVKPPSILSMDNEQVQAPGIDEVKTKSEAESKSDIKTGGHSHTHSESSVVSDELGDNMRSDPTDFDVEGDGESREANLEDCGVKNYDDDDFSSSTVSDDQQVIYAKPVRNCPKHQADKSDVIIVEGEVIIEPSGFSVPVTTAPPAFINQHIFDNLTPLLTCKPGEKNSTAADAKYMMDRAENNGEVIDINTDTENVNVTREVDSNFLSVPVIGEIADISSTLRMNQEIACKTNVAEESTSKIL